MHLSFHPFVCQLAHFHAPRWYVHVVAAFTLAHHYRALLARDS